MASDIQIIGIILLLCLVGFMFGWTVREMAPQIKAVLVEKEYTHTELADYRLLYVLYDERGLVHECNDGRISKIYIEGRENVELSKENKAKAERTARR